MPNNPFHPYKAVAIDLDGTLIDHDLKISAENFAALDELRDSGIEIILASGRHHCSMLPYAKQIPAVKWMVSAQGGFASDVDLRTVLYENFLPADDAAHMIDTGIANKYSLIVYAKSGIYSLNESEWIDYYTDLAGIQPTLVEKSQILSESIFKVVLLDTEQRIEAAHDLEAVRNWSLYKVRSLKNIYEFAGEGTSKAHALKPLLAHLAISPDELVTFGDAPNDIPMFELSGMSYGMNHGWDAAKAAAKKLSPEGDPATAFSRCIADLKVRP